MIYICIPTHNEQQTVGVVLWKLRQVLTDFPRDYQLLVADDASTDKTPEVLEPYTRVLPLTVIRSDQRHGYAASLEMLLREAVRRSEYPRRDVVVALQADFSDEPDDLVPLVKRLEAGADIAVGNKVSTTPETRTRRFSRSLARFFMRRQKWPEGVSTPFEGYRAYRLHAVRKAIEERAGRRLIRYDGWAGHAELLRAVLPHARRVDVVDVDDRPDRLQRPRREKPFAAALQVRAMAGGAEPQGVVGVEELDRIAATASRSRDRSTVTVQPAPNGRSRTNGGGRTRNQRTDTRQPRNRQQPSGRAERARPEGAGRGEERQPRKRGAEGKSATQKTRSERSPRQRREPRSPGPGGKPTAAEGAVAPAEEVVQGTAAEESLTPSNGGASPADGLAADGGEQKPKRRRRRRRRSGTKSGGAAASSAGSAESEAAVQSPDGGEAGASAGLGDDSSDADPASEGGAARKRRRRGGRRGGRGRRRPNAEGAQETGAPDAEKPAGGPSVEPQGAAPAQTD